MGDEPIDINAERNKRASPDAEFVRKDDFGRPMYTFTCSYEMSDGDYVMHLWAYSFEDAQRRMDAIRASGKVDGQVMTEIRP